MTVTTFVETALVIAVILLVILGLILGFNRLSQTQTEEEEKIKGQFIVCPHCQEKIGIQGKE